MPDGPARSLPPVSSLDRRSDGERIGPCPKCGGHRWWDNRAAKRIGQASPKGPDFRCTACGHGLWESDASEGWRPEGTKIARAVDARGDPVRHAMGPARQCVAVKANGERCRNGAMKGSDRCGPHSK